MAAEGKVAAALKRDGAETDAPMRDYSSPMPRLDFSKPAGDPGLLGPGSLGWKVSANPIAGAVGVIAAVILELAEKHVRAGVWDHSTFKVDPIRRMERTGMAAAAVTYGPTKMAEMTFQRVTRMHERVTGTTHDGDAYRAMDPKLLTWVHVTAAWGFFNALHESGALLEAATAMARELARGPTFAHGMTKTMLSQEWAMTIEQAIEAEAQAQAICMQTQDFRRAYEAFAAKQKPVFGGD